MRSTVHVHEPVAGWEIARPSSPAPVAGVSLAGFRSCGTGPADVRVVPHPAFTLGLPFGDGLLVVDTATGRRHRGSLAMGFPSGAIRVRGSDIECVQVRLSPLIARAVLGTAPSDLGDTVITLDDLWGREAARIRQRLDDASSWQERFALVEALIARRADSVPPLDSPVTWAWDQLVVSRGRVRIENLAAEIGWSRKRLWSRFRSQIGLPPKRAARLLRFDHAAHRLAAGTNAATVAADSGYVDQPHLHRDFMAFTGATPSTVTAGPWMAVDDLAWAGAGTDRTYGHLTPLNRHAAVRARG